MGKKLRQSLPEMDDRLKKAVEAMETIEDIYTKCLKELHIARQNYDTLLARANALGEQWSSLEDSLYQSSREREPSERKYLAEQLARVQQASQEVSTLLKETLDKMSELDEAIVALEQSPKNPEIAEA